MPITHDQLVAAIRAIGVRSGDLLIAHSSFKSLGGVSGGPAGVAGALIEAVTPDGSIFMPTFNFGELAFDPKTTRSLTGATTEAFRTLPGVVRSEHPTHSVAGFGPAASEILAEHRPLNVFGRGSPLWRLWERNACVLLIGCDHRSNSMIHVAEEIVVVPQLHRTRVGRVVRGGAELPLEVRRPGCSESFNIVDSPLRSKGLIIDGVAGNARLMLMRSVDLASAAVDLLKHDPTALLCRLGSCDVCDEARAMIAVSSPAR